MNKVPLPLFIFFLLLLPASTHAFTAVFNDLAEPYGVYTIDDISAPASYFGELSDFPDTYEFTLSEAEEFTAELWAYPDEREELRFSGILVREQVGGGVKEIARLNGGEWTRVKDEDTKITYLEGPEYRNTIPAGTYRFEVSNPENVGQYQLRIGGERQDEGYFATLGDISAVYEFHDRSKLGMIFVPLIYLPFGIVLLLALIYFTRKYRRPAS